MVKVRATIAGAELIQLMGKNVEHARHFQPLRFVRKVLPAVHVIKDIKSQMVFVSVAHLVRKGMIQGDFF